MPPLPPAANTLKCSLGWGIGGNSTAETILHFTYSGGTPSASDCAGFAADFQAAAVTNLKALITVDGSIRPCTVQDLNTSSGFSGIGGSTTAGTRTGGALSGGTCVVMNHAIARRYRGGKPRSYCPFGTTAELQSLGTWTSSFLTTVNSDWSAFITACKAATVSGITITNFVNVSYHNNKALRPTPVIDPILASSPRLRLGSQRRRLKTA